MNMWQFGFEIVRVFYQPERPGWAFAALLLFLIAIVLIVALAIVIAPPGLSRIVAVLKF